MKDTTVTIYVLTDSFTLLMQHLNVLKGIGLDNDYTFIAKDVKWSEMKPEHDHVTLNISVESYISFKIKYNEMLNNN